MQCIGVSFREFPLAKMVRMLPGRSFLSLCHSSTDLRSGHQHPVPMSPPLLTAGPFVVPLLNLQDPGATTKALEERISKLRRQAREELAAVDLLPSDVPVTPSGPSIQTGYPGPSILTRSPSPSNPSHASISATKSIPIGPPLQSHHSSRQLLPQDSQSSLINFPIRTYEISPRKRRTMQSTLTGYTSETNTSSTSGSRKRGRVGITPQRAAEKARMFGGAVDDEDAAFREATSKRAQKQEEENGDHVQEIDKAERAVAQQVRRPYGMGGDAEAGKEGVLSTPLPEVAPEVVGEVKGGDNKADNRSQRWAACPLGRCQEGARC